MRYVILVRSCPEFESHPSTGVRIEPALLAAMASFHEELARSGVLLDANGLKPSRDGWRVQFDAKGGHVIDGPFAETKELIAGYTLIQVASRQEALEWSRRFPNPAGEGRIAEIEVRELQEFDDFAPSDDVERFRRLEASP